jgi:hypothetical protein
MKNWITQLWQGEIGLARSFWEFGIAYGTLIHMAFSGVAFGAYVLEAPVWLAVVLFFAPLPYAILVVVAVWRSADRYLGPPHWAQAARISIVIWAVLVTVL